MINVILPATITLEDIQYGLSELYSCAQLFTAIAGLLAIFLPILRSFAIYHSCIDWLLGVIDVVQHHLITLPSLIKGTTITTTNKNSETKICLGSNRSDTMIWVAGLVNTKNSCFLNVVLQALSSLVTLHAYLNDQYQYTIKEDKEQYDQGPITGSLWKTIRQLSQPLKRSTSFRPREMVASLLSKRVILNREQQDAQELFQLIVGALDAEASITARKRNASLLGTSGLKLIPMMKQQQIQFIHTTTTPFTGLLASRLSCIQCGYTEAVRHFSFNNIQLIVPRAHTTTLDACLRQFTSIEYLKDATCRRCSLLHTLRTLQEQYQNLVNKPNRKKKTKKLIQEIESRIKTNRIEEEIQGIQRVESPLSTKQVMFAKPPKILCLHLSRSAFHASGAVYKNTCQILFPEFLDLAPYTTNGNLSTEPKQPISSPIVVEGGEDWTSHYQKKKKKTIKTFASTTRYRLMSSIVHYGSHSYGHFVAFKRRIVPKKCTCPNCCDDKGRPESWEDSQDQAWYRISDTKVDLCSFDIVQQSNPYMLLYELMDDTQQQYTAMEKEDVEDLLVAATTKNDHDPQTSAPSTPPFPDVDDGPEQEALRIANSLFMDDYHQSSHLRWSSEEDKKKIS